MYAIQLGIYKWNQMYDVVSFSWNQNKNIIGLQIKLQD